MNKLLDFYLKNEKEFYELSMNEIIEKWAKLFYGNFEYHNNAFIISIQQQEPFTRMFFPINVIENKYKAVKNNQYFDINLVIKNINWKNKKVDKLTINLDYYTLYRYEFECDSCGEKVQGQLKDFYRIIQSNSFMCPHCKNTVAHRIKQYESKFKKSMQKSYGVDHPAQSKEIRKIMEKTCMDKFGYSTPFGSPDLRNLAYDTMLEKYGKKGISGFGGGKRISLLENSFIKHFLLEYNNSDDDIYCDYLNKQYYIDTESGKKWMDLYIKNKKTVIQIHGDFWHGNLKIFNEDKIHPIYKMTFSDVYNRSYNRDQEVYKSNKIKAYFVIWESSIHQNEDNIIKNIISKINEGFNGFIEL
jgi:G:T-mismatch repair DNA endonuclease (very short patch repair protein)